MQRLFSFQAPWESTCQKLKRYENQLVKKSWKKQEQIAGIIERHHENSQHKHSNAKRRFFFILFYFTGHGEVSVTCWWETWTASCSWARRRKPAAGRWEGLAARAGMVQHRRHPLTSAQSKQKKKKNEFFKRKINQSKKINWILELWEFPRGPCGGVWEGVGVLALDSISTSSEDFLFGDRFNLTSRLSISHRWQKRGWREDGQVVVVVVVVVVGWVFVN